MNLLVLIKPAIQYANAVVMTLKEMAKTLASTLEVMYEIDYETEFAGFSNLTEGAEATTEALEELSKKVEQLPFDKLNILGDTGTTSSNLAIDENILGGLKEYKIFLDNINYKAKDVSKTILTWLGYTQYVDEETGEVGYKLNYTGSNLQLIIKAIGTIAGIITGLSIKAKLTSILPIIQKIGEKIGLTVPQIGLIITAITTAITGFAELYLKVDDFRENINTTLNSIMNNLKKLGIDLTDVKNSFKAIGVTISTTLGNALAQILELIEVILSSLNSLINLDMTGLLNSWGAYSSQLMTMFNRIVREGLILLLGNENVADFAIQMMGRWFQELKYKFKNTLLKPIQNDITSFSNFITNDIWQNIQKFFKSIPTWFNNNVWKPIGNFFIGLINNIISGFENMINFFIKGINKLIGGVGEALSYVGINIGTIQEVSFGRIPALARGGIIDRPTTALVGEYAGAKTNPEIVTPESLMREVFIESMLPIAQAIMSGNKEVVNAIEDMANRPIEMDGRKVSERLYSHLEDVAIRKGKTLFGT